MKTGFTLAEIAIVVVIVGILAALGAPRFGKVLDQLAVARSMQETMAFYRSARFAAIVSGKFVRIEFSADSLVGVFEGQPDTVFMRVAGPAVHAVSLTVSRATIRISATGLGYGAANTKLVFRRRTAADSLATSRLGRVRRIR
jgi:prepilin-type N-terminal cleavage/methylation domain-containing protein